MKPKCDRVLGKVRTTHGFYIQSLVVIACSVGDVFGTQLAKPKKDSGASLFGLGGGGRFSGSARSRMENVFGSNDNSGRLTARDVFGEPGGELHVSIPCVDSYRVITQNLRDNNEGVSLPLSFQLHD